MFDLDKLESAMAFSVEEKMKTMVKEIKESLSSPYYEKIMDNFSINIVEGDFRFSINLKSEIKAENQDVLRVLTYGGVFEKKNKEFISVSPNMVLMRYFP